MKLKLYLLFFIALPMLVSSQEGEFGTSTLMAPSPSAYELGRYGFENVGLYTGSPSLNIPLYTLGVNNYSLPISLQYSSNGIKVDQISTETGLGWSLNAGGIITRILRDESDEISRVNLPSAGINSQEMESFLFGTINGTGADTQPDLFSFNFNGYSGKFYLNNNLEPTLIDPLPLKIEMISQYEFRITDPNGVVYYFGEGNAFEESSTRTYGIGGSSDNIMSLPAITAWYLTTIELLNGEEITFSYDQINPIYDLSIYQSLSAKKSVNPYVNGGYPVYTSAVHKLPKIVKQISTTQLVNRIDFNNGHVEFEYSKRYDGISTNFKKLDSLLVYNNNDFLIKKMEFSYDQQSTLGSFENPDNIGIDQTNSKRLFLSEVIETTDEQNKKSYNLEYYNPDELAPRLSYSQDYWGYFNGKNNPDLVTDDISSYNVSSYDDPNINHDLLMGLFSNVGGDKSADGIYGVKGMIKKVTYPTGGHSTFIYEPHSYYGVETIPTNLESKSININTLSGDLQNSDTVSTGVIPYDQEKIPLYFSTDTLSCWGSGWPSHKIKTVLSVRYKPTGSSNFICDPLTKGFYQINQNGQKSYEPYCSISREIGDLRQFYIDFEQGYEYEFTLSLNWECLRGDLSFSFYDQAPQIVNTNIEVGGLRIKQNIINDGLGNEEVKSYHYGDLNCLDCSSGEMESMEPAMSFITYDYFDSFNGQAVETVATLNSSTMRPLYDSSGYHINYRYVIEENGDDFFGGGVLHEFNIVYDNLPYVFGDLIPGFPRSNGFGNGKEKLIQNFKLVGNDYITTREVIRNYNYQDNRLDETIEGFQASYRTKFDSPNSTGNGATFYDFNLNKFDVNSHWVYLDQEVISDFDTNGENPIITTKNYFYDNENHLQLTKSEVTNSNGDLLKTEMYYPDDIITTGTLPGEPITATQLMAIDDLKSTYQHRINIPIQSDRTINGETSRTRTIYKEWVSNSTGSTTIIEPQYIKFQKGSDSLENRLVFYKYDSFGNTLEVGKPLGIISSYLWGYGNQYPVAKVDNATYSQLLGTGVNLTTLNDISSSEVAVATELDKLRNLSNSFATTHTYIPLIGVTSTTDPSGYTTYYDYNDNNRLQYIKNKDSKVVKSFDYNYKQIIPQYTITSTTNGNGTVVLSDSEVNEGGNVLVTVTPDSGYQISTITVNGTSHSTSSPFTLSNITSNTVVDVQFSVISPSSSVSPTSMSFNWIDGNKTVTVTASGSWTVSKSASWITISATSGSGNGTFTVRPLKNLGSERSGTVTVTISGVTETISIYQADSNGS